jgi:hypothetical protein
MLTAGVEDVERAVDVRTAQPCPAGSHLPLPGQVHDRVGSPHERADLARVADIEAMEVKPGFAELGRLPRPWQLPDREADVMLPGESGSDDPAYLTVGPGDSDFHCATTLSAQPLP